MRTEVAPEVLSSLLPVHLMPAVKPAADISGTWRLVFSTATSFRPFQYIPVQVSLTGLLMCLSAIKPAALAVRQARIHY